MKGDDILFEIVIFVDEFVILIICQVEVVNDKLWLEVL